MLEKLREKIKNDPLIRGGLIVGTTAAIAGVGFYLYFFFYPSLNQVNEFFFVILF